jgi:hypothetical protein
VASIPNIYDNRPNSEKLEKATIAKVSKSGSVSLPGLACHFNPETFKLDKTVEWNQDQEANIGNDVPPVTFGGGKSAEMPIELLFDTTATGEDVRDTYKLLVELTEIDPATKNSTTSKGEPPRCKFMWGKFLSFTAVITKLGQTFTMFKADGTPLRAKVSVTLLRVPEKPKGQNPTSVSEPRKIWVVESGQTLDWIAYVEYGDPNHWRHIAAANNLINPKDLQAGQVLKLVPLV